MKTDITKRKVVHINNCQSRYPVSAFLVWFLCLDYWNAPEWLWAVVITLVVLFIAGITYNKLVMEEPTDPFKKE